MAGRFLPALVLALLFACGCKGDCARLCERQASCERDARLRAGLGDLTPECTERCEAMAKTEAGGKAVAGSVACVQDDCTAMARCLTAEGRAR